MLFMILLRDKIIREIDTYLRSDLIATLAGLKMYYFAHVSKTTFLVLTPL